MVAGGAFYGASYPLMKATVIRMGQLGKITLPQVTGLSHWVVIFLFASGCLALFRLFEKKGV